MKILTVITESEMGGAQVHAVDLVSGCREYCEVALATGDTGYLTEKAQALGIPVHIVPGLIRPFNAKQDMRALLGLIRLIRQVRPDVIHAHTYKAGLLGRLAAFVCGVPSVYTAHTWCFQPGTGNWWKKIGLLGEWLSARLSFRIITVSEANRSIALSFHVGSRKRIATVHNGVRDLAIRAQPAADGPPCIVMVARFVVQKDQASLIEALGQVKGDWRLKFVGGGPTLPQARARVQELGIADRVEFLGERKDVPNLLSQANIFALTTHLEGLPLGILEAMRAGLPIVASDVGGICETIDDGETGFLIPHGDLDTLRNSLEKLISSAALRRRMGAASREKYEREFGYQGMLDKTIDIYRAACNGRSGRGPRFRILFPVSADSRAEAERRYEKVS
jgi:glycosyltransferase involved in cell wall biosynthesis